MKRHLLTTLILGLCAVVTFLGATGCERSVPEPATPTPEIVLSPQSPPPTSDAAAATVISVLEATPGTPVPTIRWDLPTFTPTTQATVPVTATSVPPTSTPVPANPTPAPTASQPTSISYTVEWGDTLYGLAARYNTTVAAIVAASNLINENLIGVGQVLTIPLGQQNTPNQPNTSSQTYTIQAGDTLYNIASTYNTTVAAIAQRNGIMNPAFISIGQQIVIPVGTSGTGSSGGSVHVVQPGDTLTAIAARFGTSVWAIAVTNNLPNSNFIRAGQTLIIPAP